MTRIEALKTLDHEASDPSLLIGIYRELLDKYSELAAEAGIEITPARESMGFSSLDRESQLKIVDNLRENVQILAEIHEEGGSLRDERSVLWRNLVQRHWRPPADLMAKVDGEKDIVEIYDLRTMVQVYRSFRFFSVCSYSVDDILCRPWYELFHRDPAVNDMINAKVARMMAENETRVMDYEVPPHVISETDSPRQLRWLGQNRFLSPLFDEHNGLVGAVNVVRAFERLPTGATKE